MQFKDYPVGWNEIEHSVWAQGRWKTLLLMLPNGKYKLAWAIARILMGARMGIITGVLWDFVRKVLTS